MAPTGTCHDHGTRYIPFHLCEGMAPGGRCSLFGNPPCGILPACIEEQTRYLGTLGLDDDWDVSLFMTFDYSTPESPSSFFKRAGKLMDETFPLVQFSVHRPVAERETASPLAEGNPMLGFSFGPMAEDPDDFEYEDAGECLVYEDHKIGGVPYFEQLEADVLNIASLLRSGFVHVLQLAFPGPEDAPVAGSWPFCGYVFHVFARKEADGYHFRYIWC